MIGNRYFQVKSFSQEWFEAEEKIWHKQLHKISSYSCLQIEIKRDQGRKNILFFSI